MICWILNWPNMKEYCTLDICWCRTLGIAKLWNSLEKMVHIHDLYIWFVMVCTSPKISSVTDLPIQTLMYLYFHEVTKYFLSGHKAWVHTLYKGHKAWVCALYKSLGPFSQLETVLFCIRAWNSVQYQGRMCSIRTWNQSSVTPFASRGWNHTYSLYLNTRTWHHCLHQGHANTFCNRE